jgi:hypothetical protein
VATVAKYYSNLQSTLGPSCFNGLNSDALLPRHVGMLAAVRSHDLSWPVLSSWWKFFVLKTEQEFFLLTKLEQLLLAFRLPGTSSLVFAK